MRLISVFKNVLELKKIMRMDLSSIQRLQQHRFLRLVQFAKQRSPFYAKLYRDIDVDKDLGTEDLPTVNKKLLMDNYDDSLTVKGITKKQLIDFCASEKDRFKINNKYTVLHSGGSSGLLWLSLIDDRCFDYEIATIIENRIYDPMKYLFKKKKPRIASVSTENPHVGSSVFRKNIPDFLLNMRYFSVSRPIAEIVEGLNDFKPDILGGYPSMIKELAEQKIKGALRISPQKVFSGGALFSEDVRQSVIKAFSCTPFNGYYATEATGPIALECEYHSLHVYLQALILEILDLDGRPVPVGQPGKAIFTNLMNFTQPIIRYSLDDVIQMSPLKCRCGCSLPIISKIWGRTGDMLWVKKPDNNYEIIEPILFNLKIPGLEKLQVVQEDNDFLRIKIIAAAREKEVSNLVEKAISKILDKKGLLGIVKIKVERVPEILSEPGTEKTLFKQHKMVISKTGLVDERK
ncbi:phenylacetate--CoA ligase family protein [Candidatus Omnitrophota bacterium]